MFKFQTQFRKILQSAIAILPILIFSQDDLDIKVYRETDKNVSFIYVDNNELSPISTEYSHTLTNQTSTLANNSITVIPALAKRFLLTTVKPKDPTKPSKFSYNFYYVLGDVKSQNHNDQYVYTLPFDKGKSYRIYQGYNGAFSHHNALSLDFSLNEGEKVMAAREGKVVLVVEEHDRGCPSKECAKMANKILIEHNDGSFGEYVHLQKNGSAVKPGDKVAAGDFLGYSGNTGWSQGPHLHFSVFYNNMDGTRKYIKTQFRTAQNPKPVFLSEKQTYSRPN